MNIYHTAIDRTPYTYLIGWSKYDVYYYGVRYAKNCHPSEFWIHYKTSSEYVKAFCDFFGNPDIIKIRKIFCNTSKAILWEKTFLTKVNAAKNPHFLNKTNGSNKIIILCGRDNAGSRRKDRKMSDWFSEIQIKNHKKAMTKRHSGSGNVHAKKCIVVSPKNEQYIIYGEMEKFCNDHLLSFKTLFRSLKYGNGVVEPLTIKGLAALQRKNNKMDLEELIKRRNNTTGWRIRYA